MRETREQKIDRLETETAIKTCELDEMEQGILNVLPLAGMLDSQTRKMLKTWPPITEILEPKRKPEKKE